ncbi:MAG: ABC transporter permease, partial [Pseudanabaena sp.]
MKSSKQSVSQRLMSIGIVISVVFLLMAIISPLLQALGLLNPTEFLSYPIHESPSAQHWFGTDLQGHDVFARTIAGAGVAWQVTIASTTISLVIGVPLGM